MEWTFAPIRLVGDLHFLGHPHSFIGDPHIFIGDPRFSFETPRWSGGLQRKSGVSNQSIGVFNENLRVFNEKWGYSMRIYRSPTRPTPIVLQWWWYLPRLQDTKKGKGTSWAGVGKIHLWLLVPHCHLVASLILFTSIRRALPGSIFKVIEPLPQTLII